MTEETTTPETETTQPAVNPPDGVIGFVLSIVGLFVPLLWIASLIIAISDKNKSKELGAEPVGLVKAAFWISLIGLVLSALAALFVLLSILVIAGVATESTSSSGMINLLF